MEQDAYEGRRHGTPGGLQRAFGPVPTRQQPLTAPPTTALPAPPALQMQLPQQLDPICEHGPVTTAAHPHTPLSPGMLQQSFRPTATSPGDAPAAAASRPPIPTYPPARAPTVSELLTDPAHQQAYAAMLQQQQHQQQQQFLPLSRGRSATSLRATQPEGIAVGFYPMPQPQPHHTQQRSPPVSVAGSSSIGSQSPGSGPGSAQQSSILRMSPSSSMGAAAAAALANGRAQALPGPGAAAGQAAPRRPRVNVAATAAAIAADGGLAAAGGGFRRSGSGGLVIGQTPQLATLGGAVHGGPAAAPGHRAHTATGVPALDGQAECSGGSSSSFTMGLRGPSGGGLPPWLQQLHNQQQQLLLQRLPSGGSGSSGSQARPGGVAGLTQSSRRAHGDNVPHTANGGGSGANGNSHHAGPAPSTAELEILSTSAPVRGWRPVPRSGSISEIEPCPDERPAPSSSLSRAIMIPGAGRPRTYRVAAAGDGDDVTVVLEQPDGDHCSYGYGRDRDPDGSAHARRSGPGAGGPLGAAAASGPGRTSGSGSGGAGSILSASFAQAGGLLSGLLGRGGAGGAQTPDSSVHGGDSLPHTTRFGSYQDVGVLGALLGGSVPAPPGGLSSSLPRAGRGGGGGAAMAHASPGSVLTKATGGLMKKSMSMGSFAAGPGWGAAERSSGAAALGPERSAHGAGSPSAGGLAAFRSQSQRVSAAGGAGGSTRGGRSFARSSTQLRAEQQQLGGGSPVEPDLADLAMLATSLPASFGSWSLPRSMALGPAGGSPGPLRSLSRNSSATSFGAGGGDRSARGGAGMAPGGMDGFGAASTGAGAGPSGGATPVAATSYPICLICLEMLLPEEFARGDAMELQCACKGPVSLRHRKCAIEWSHHKGDIWCDICKQPIANLPPIPEEVLAAREAARRRRQPQFNTASEPNFADYLFDCIRATWVTVIVCVLFFDFPVGRAFLMGAVTGVLFALFSVVVTAYARRARAVAAARAVERAAEASLQDAMHGGTGHGAQQGQGGAGGSGLTQPLLADVV